MISLAQYQILQSNYIRFGIFVNVYAPFTPFHRFTANIIKERFRFIVMNNLRLLLGLALARTCFVPAIVFFLILSTGIDLRLCKL